MSSYKKRTYNSENRLAQAVQTRKRVLDVAKKLFQTEGIELVTIEKLAKKAEVSASTIYALFQSKRGILRAIMDEAMPSDQYEALLEQVEKEKSAKGRLLLAVKIARQMYDAESAQMDIFRGASVLAPELKELEKEREDRRYKRQEASVKQVAKELTKGQTLIKARDILWAFTGRDMYRLFVIEKGWSPDAYEKWLGELLIKTLLG